MTVTSKFASLTREEPDPIMKTMNAYANDTSANKIEVAIGVYKDSLGGSYLFPSIAKAKQHLHENDPGHNYTQMSGIPSFVRGAQRVIFGEEIASQGKIASLQTISGTGAIHMGLLVYKEAGYKNYYLGLPAWQNYIPMIEHVGSTVKTFTYYDEAKKTLDFESCIQALESAPKNTIFLLQACCHNPTGADFTHDQWVQITQIMKSRELLPMLDIAYQGFASGDKDVDAFPIRHMYNEGLDFVVCQSFSKNMGLYSERVGCVHVVVQDKTYVPHAQSTLTAMFRHECSFAPAYGARLASIIFEDPKLLQEWNQDVRNVRDRMQHMRQLVFDKLTKLATPGDWSNVVEQTGLFWFSGLTEEQNNRLIEKHNVYSTSMGRVNIAGLNEENVDYFCKAIDEVVRATS
ncbi:aspartate aminotransferase/Glutamic oxaloacetic transaminase AAT2/GOT1 [Spathaspora passalidarum NRRL Y-27907]|uniref:Aspartate aminotransferase/Glutamic oxaloacetic transaminase AAT2/GOT1 n=1 Tax=Spathaspora passalidarum (strain NRRL Y-27907 / 11-Y1) TaxID=619300 RepID=G3AT44_SPAPN|nr:aspartate aminotransferase/Glutamic oxaloacetic transaminase AAT2/GOT1 [Spathaspora passalidarum NRRL Y-27907]EGW30807.1 aspartate aminotransferase/Glutamic oxaloacetic transaminase AAT2/GOT1 [Spathaspora passalidarum NRRL Y-27907]